jgi:hypothetical protein
MTIEIKMPRLPARRTALAGELSPGLLAPKLQRRQAGRLNADATPLCHLILLRV